MFSCESCEIFQTCFSVVTLVGDCLICLISLEHFQEVSKIFKRAVSQTILELLILKAILHV